MSQLNSELSKSRKDRQSIEKELRAQKEAHTQLQEKLNSVVTMATGRVTMEEHREAMEEFQRSVHLLTCTHTHTHTPTYHFHISVSSLIKFTFINYLTSNL